MQVQNYRSYAEDSVLRAPLARIVPRLIRSLDGFLGFLGAHQPTHRDRLGDQLLVATRGWSSGKEQPFDVAARSSLLQGCDKLSEFPDLFDAHLTWLHELLAVPTRAWMDDSPVELSQVCFIRARYLPSLLKLNVLVALLGKEPAIKLMKQYLDETIKNMPPSANAPKNLTELRKRQVEFNIQEAGMDWTSAVISDHQYLNKVAVCRIEKVLAEHGDRELMDVVACYPDFAMFRKTNENFRLTRTQTLMNGGCCCDSCYHDTRFVQDFVHPALEMFASLQESRD